ncbi:amino acid permease [Mycobacterium aquaticum]|uniref:Amino acid permease n=2 Tax=Mycobacterium aquaticum TaxID=1927124 RepID=A0A1X0AXC0_9MYCO|nr:amino acid permease [Mycobacterium aquaticum]
MASLTEQALRRKPVGMINAETGADTGKSELKRSIGLWGLSAIGIGGTIGTGIFFILSQAVPIAGPAVLWSFVLSAVVAGLTAVCYAELAGAVPVAGSSYSYAYTTLGEVVALGVGACLLLEWGVAGAATAVGWSQYVNQFLLNVFHFQLPSALSNAPEEGGICNVPAIILILMCAVLLIRGVSESAKTNAIMVAIKLAVLVMFVLIGIQGFNTDNMQPFAPHGIGGVTTAASIIFFTFVGLDGVAAAGEEAKNPHRNLPLAIMISLITVTVMYVLVALVALGAQPSGEFDGQEAGLAKILENVTGQAWPGTVLAAGAIISIFSVTLVSVYGQTRILFAMSRDGMIPPIFHKVNPRTLTPVPNTIIVAVVIAILAGFIPINFLAEMTSVGTLAAFVTVSIGVIVLRRRAPELPRTFKVPLYPITPILSVLGALWIIASLRTVTIYVFVIWVGLALVWYFVYARSHSHLGRHEHVGLDAAKEEPQP